MSTESTTTPSCVANIESTENTDMPVPKRRGRKPKSLSQTTSSSQTNILQKQTAKPQENVVLYLKTLLTPSQKNKIKEYC